MSPPPRTWRIVGPTPEENARARAHVRAAIEAAVRITAEELADQPLSVKALLAKMLIEDFADIDDSAALAWLAAVTKETAADASCDDQLLAAGQRDRAAAFARLAEAHIAQRAERYP